jgi:hypothetical protein
MTSALFYTFFIFEKKNTVQKIPTKIYRVTVSVVKICAVKVTLYLGAHTAFYPHFPYMSDGGERRLKCLHVRMLTICCTTTGVWKTVPLLRAQMKLNLSMCLENITPFLKYRPPCTTPCSTSRDTPVTAQLWNGRTDRPAAIWWVSGVLMPLMHTTVSDRTVHSCSPNTTNAHHSIRLNSTLLHS